MTFCPSTLTNHVLQSRRLGKFPQPLGHAFHVLREWQFRAFLVDRNQLFQFRSGSGAGHRHANRMIQILTLLACLFLHSLGDLAKARVGEGALGQHLWNECLQHLDGGGVGEQFLEIPRWPRLAVRQIRK